MKERYIDRCLEEFCFTGNSRKMALVSGPRQCGKTTFARQLLDKRESASYYNWDDLAFRRLWSKNPSGIIPAESAAALPLVVLDEIHKDRRWKGKLKGVYDTMTRPCDILVTGSARLNVYQKKSDSLLGRYYHFRLHPFSLREMSNARANTPDALLQELLARTGSAGQPARQSLDDLMEYGPFPEPLFAQNARQARVWQRNRHELIIRQDLRDLSQLPALERVEMLASLLPERVGSPFSISSVREYLEVNHATVKNWLNHLKELYFLFAVGPWHKKISRSLRKEGKIYLWDFSEVTEPAARFENLVACHLLKACHYWTDSGEGKFELYYLRNKEGQEIDFLLVRDGKPWLPVEAKWSATELSPNWKKFLPMLDCPLALQIVNTPGWKVVEQGNSKIIIADAAEVLACFV